MTKAVLLAGYAVLVASGSLHSTPEPHAVRLAQFGEMTKKRATPVPQRTAAPDTRQNAERRGAQPKPGGAFGGMRK